MRVNSRTAMWGYKHLWLVYDDPCPTKITLEKLSEDVREMVEQGLIIGNLFEVDEEDKPVERKISKAQDPIVDDAEECLANITPVVACQLKELLENGVVTLRREVKILKNANVLMAAMAIETKNKNRKTVIKLLKKQLEKADDLSTLSMLEKPNLYNDLIEEEIGETVTFKVSDTDVSEDKGEEEKFPVGNIVTLQMIEE